MVEAAVVMAFPIICQLRRRTMLIPIERPTIVAFSGLSKTAAAPMAIADSVSRPRSRRTSTNAKAEVHAMRKPTTWI
jgi:hypothetical protein